MQSTLSGIDFDIRLYISTQRAAQKRGTTNKLFILLGRTINEIIIKLSNEIFGALPPIPAATANRPRF